MNKERFKGMIIGFILAAVMSTGAVMLAANTQAVTRDLVYGVSISLDGQVVQFPEDSRPFVMVDSERTYLPLRAMADLLGLYVGFDEVANMATLSTTAPNVPAESRFITPNQLHAMMQEGNPNLVVLGISLADNAGISGSFTIPHIGTIAMTGGPYTTASTAANSRRPLNEMEEVLSRAGITADSTVVVYGMNAQHVGYLAWELTILGLDVLFLNGGLTGWAAADLPRGDTVNIADAPAISNFAVTNYRNDEMNIGIAGMINALQNPNEWIILDARSADEHGGIITGAGGSSFFGRIAGSVNIDWVTASVPGTQNSMLRPEAELREIFAEVLDGRSIIVYDLGGPRAARTWMILDYLGADVYVFNGGWQEWSYALDPNNNHPYHELALQFSEEQTYAGDAGAAAH